MSEKYNIPGENSNDFDIQIINEFVQLDDKDKQAVIDFIKAMLSSQGVEKKEKDCWRK